MQKSLLGHKIAFLVANGLKETDLIESQRIAQALGADTRIVSVDQGLVSSLNDQGWGLNFAADQALNQSLASDYSAVIVPGGQRSIEKLQLTAHTRRFVRGFFETGKAVCVIGEGKELLSLAEININDDTKNVFITEQVDETLPRFLKALLLEEHAVAA